MTAAFRKFAERVALAVGTPWAFIAALALIVAWAACGPFFSFSEPWQLAINSFTTIVTFLMVFIIQNTQERDFRSLQLKFDALLQASEAPDGLVGLQKLSEEDLDRLEQAFHRLRGQPNVAKIVRSLEAGSSTSASAGGPAA
jgi:low affinity Fe/Cu permease